MLPVCLYNTKEPDQGLLLDCLKECAAEQGVLYALNHDWSGISDLLALADSQAGGVMFLIGVDKLSAQADLTPLKLSRRLVKTSHDNYVVLVLQHVNDLEDVLSVSTRLAGVLCCPINQKRARNVFCMALRDYASNTRQADADQADSRAVVIKSGNTDYRLPVSQIYYVQALNKKVEVVSAHQTLQLYTNMEDIIQRMGDGFIRCHRSYIVNQQHVVQVDWTDMLITLADGSSVPFSRSYRASLKEVFS